MPTLTEITKPYLTYCQKYDIHCPCPKCNSSISCFHKGGKYCKACAGPNKININKNRILICIYTND